MYSYLFIFFNCIGVVTGSGQTYVVVQEGENLSFVPAEMVPGDLQAAVNGGQVSILHFFYVISSIAWQYHY